MVLDKTKIYLAIVHSRANNQQYTTQSNEGDNYAVVVSSTNKERW